MTKGKHTSSTALAERPRDTRKAPFRAPAEFPPQFGVQVCDDNQVQGVISTEQIRKLVDSFGLTDRSEIPIPFQHIVSQHGERWSLRIEDAAVHEFNGEHVHGHQWIYRREYPEQSAGE